MIQISGICGFSWESAKIHVKLYLQDRSSNSSQLRIQALQFLSVALEKSDPEVWRPHVAALSEPILAAVGERYSKVSAEGLRVCEALVHVIRPNLSNTIPSSLKVLDALLPVFISTVVE